MFANFVRSVAVTNLFTVVVSSISSASNTTTHVCQFTESTAHQLHHQVAFIIGYLGSVSSIVIFVQATILLTIVAHDVTPLPSVCSSCQDVPSSVGNVNV